MYNLCRISFMKLKTYTLGVTFFNIIYKAKLILIETKEKKNGKGVFYSIYFIH